MNAPELDRAEVPDTELSTPVRTVTVQHRSASETRRSAPAAWWCGPFLAAALLVSCAGERTAEPQGAETPPPPFDLLGSADLVELPFEVTDGYVFLEGSVRGLRGVFLFDTGSPFPFFLNRHAVPLELGRPVGSGSAASGQRLTLQAHDDVGPITLAGVTFDDPGTTRSADFAFLEQGIRPDILGFAGFPLVKDHAFELDYDAEVLTILRLRLEGDPIVLTFDPQDVLVVLSFTNEQENLPRTTIRIDDVLLEVLFDTGSPGSSCLTAEARQSLEAAGRLIHSDDGDTWSGWTAPNGLELTAVTAFVEPGDGNRITLGSRFLRNYRSVWNSTNRTITLLTPVGESR